MNNPVTFEVREGDGLSDKYLAVTWAVFKIQWGVLTPVNVKLDDFSSQKSVFDDLSCFRERGASVGV